MLGKSPHPIHLAGLAYLFSFCGIPQMHLATLRRVIEHFGLR